MFSTLVASATTAVLLGSSVVTAVIDLDIDDPGMCLRGTDRECCFADG